MLRRHIILLIAIRLLDGDVNPGGPLDAFLEEQAMSWHRVSPTPFLSSSFHTPQHNYNTQTATHTVTLTSTYYSTLIQILFPHIMWSAPVVDNWKTDHTQCHLSPCVEPEACSKCSGLAMEHTHISKIYPRCTSED